MSPLKEATIAIVGTGAMAEAMIAGLLSGGHVAAAQIIASDPRAERREAVESKYGIRTTGANSEAVDGADVVVLAIKPQMLLKVGRELSAVLAPDQLVISSLAGSTSKALGNALRHDAIVRTMPNTPAQLGQGMTVWCATGQVTEVQRQQAAA